MKRKCGWLVFLLVFLLCGCSRQQRVGICFRQSEEPMTVLLEQQLTRSLKDLGYRVVTVDANQDQARQYQQIRKLLKKTDILIVEPVLTAEAGPIAHMAQQGQVPVIFLNNPPEESVLLAWEQLSFVGCDRTQPGLQQGTLVSELPDGGDKNGDGVVSYVVISGPEEHLDAAYWAQTCAEPFHGKCLGLEYGDWSKKSGEVIAGRALSLYAGELEVIFCAGSEMTQGALEAAETYRRTLGEDLEVVGIGGDWTLLDQLRRGEVTGLVCPDIPALSGSVTQVVNRRLTGQPAEKMCLVDFVCVTAENVDRFVNGNNAPEQ